jgi:hypothetical protein
MKLVRIAQAYLIGTQLGFALPAGIENQAYPELISNI